MVTPALRYRHFALRLRYRVYYQPLRTGPLIAASARRSGEFRRKKQRTYTKDLVAIAMVWHRTTRVTHAVRVA